MVMRSVALFVLAAVAEIGGAWLVWQGARAPRPAVGRRRRDHVLAALTLVSPRVRSPNLRSRSRGQRIRGCRSPRWLPIGK